MALQKSLAANAPTSKNLPGVKSRTQLLFLDDLNSADVDEFGIQPPLELLRQILSQGNNIPVTLYQDTIKLPAIDYSNTFICLMFTKSDSLREIETLVL